MILLIILVVVISSLFPGVQVVQDSTVSILLNEAIYGKGEMVEIDGYRVQIYSSNEQQAARNEALELESEFKQKVQQPVYVTHTPPFWKVRLGNFRTYEEANEFRKVLLEQYPNLRKTAYVVRDKIQVWQ